MKPEKFIPGQLFNSHTFKNKMFIGNVGEDYLFLSIKVDRPIHLIKDYDIFIEAIPNKGTLRGFLENLDVVRPSTELSVLFSKVLKLISESPERPTCYNSEMKKIVVPKNYYFYMGAVFTSDTFTSKQRLEVVDNISSVGNLIVWEKMFTTKPSSKQPKPWYVEETTFPLSAHSRNNLFINQQFKQEFIF